MRKRAVLSVLTLVDPVGVFRAELDLVFFRVIELLDSVVCLLAGVTERTLAALRYILAHI